MTYTVRQTVTAKDLNDINDKMDEMLPYKPYYISENICKNCQYWREESWCSNSKSPNFLYSDVVTGWDKYVTAKCSCDEFYQRGKKAPVWMRFVIWLLGKVSSWIRK